MDFYAKPLLIYALTLMYRYYMSFIGPSRDDYLANLCH